MDSVHVLVLGWLPEHVRISRWKLFSCSGEKALADVRRRLTAVHARRKFLLSDVNSPERQKKSLTCVSEFSLLLFFARSLFSQWGEKKRRNFLMSSEQRNQGLERYPEQTLILFFYTFQVLLKSTKRTEECLIMAVIVMLFLFFLSDPLGTQQKWPKRSTLFFWWSDVFYFWVQLWQDSLAVWTWGEHLPPTKLQVLKLSGRSSWKKSQSSSWRDTWCPATCVPASWRRGTRCVRLQVVLTYHLNSVLFSK